MMISSFYTPKKEYILNTEKYICNRFGLAEFFAIHVNREIVPLATNVLDVGCGAGPLGIFLADQFECNVKGIDLNLQACYCCEKNIAKYGLENKFEVLHRDFSELVFENSDAKYDCIVANPPIDSRVKYDTISKFANSDYTCMDAEKFSFLTNSWHTKDGKDLVDYIFLYAKKNLKENGSIIIVMCLIDCDSAEYVIQKGNKYDFKILRTIEGEILPTSIGAESITDKPVTTYILQFVKEGSKNYFEYTHKKCK